MDDVEDTYLKRRDQARISVVRRLTSQQLTDDANPNCTCDFCEHYFGMNMSHYMTLRCESTAENPSKVSKYRKRQLNSKRGRMNFPSANLFGGCPYCCLCAGCNLRVLKFKKQPMCTVQVVPTSILTTSILKVHLYPTTLNRPMTQWVSLTCQVFTKQTKLLT